MLQCHMKAVLKKMLIFIDDQMLYYWSHGTMSTLTLLSVILLKVDVQLVNDWKTNHLDVINDLHPSATYTYYVHVYVPLDTFIN